MTPPSMRTSLPVRNARVGDLTLDYEALDLPGDAGQRILVYSAEPASASQQALDLLASWASTPAAADRFEAPSQAKSPPAHQRSNLGRTSAPTGSSSRPPGERT